jgi:hypothetical protein
LCEASNTKKWKLLVCKASELGYNNIMLVDEFLDGGMQAESSNTCPLHENLEATNS